MAFKTEIHEIGHSFDAGNPDDKSIGQDPKRKFTRNGEVYSGSDADSTPELFKSRSEWSIMASGWDDDMVILPMNGRYYVYSIEELLSM